MKNLAAAVAISVFLASALPADETAKEQAQAAAYFEALMAADVEKANSLVNVPYSLDRKRILKSKDQVDAVHQQIAERKGKRPVPKYRVAKTDEAPKLDAAVFPKYVAFRVFVDDKPQIDIYVSVDELSHVLGFSD